MDNERREQLTKAARKSGLTQEAAEKVAERFINVGKCICPFCNYHRQFDQTPTPLPDGVPTGSVWSDEEQRWVHADVPTVSDGFGSTWGPCVRCGAPMQVVRPGKAQCSVCE